MSENIAGYIDRSYIKGQYYRYAACPKPAVSAANFNEISEDILAKALFIARGQTAGGTFPNDTDNNFLLTTVEYGSSIYLQTAYSVSDGCEYRRIYSNGNWTDWFKFDSKVNAINTNYENLSNQVNDIKTNTETGLPYAINLANSAVGTANGAKTTAESFSGSINSINNSIESLKTSLQPLGPKMVLVTKTVSSAGLTLTGQWCISGEISIDISDKGFTTVTNVLVGQATSPNFPAIVYLTGFNKNTIKYHYGSYAQGTVKNRTDTFLVIGT